MKASRLKTIVIVILLLVNAFLLFLLLSRRAEQNAAYERSIDQLASLYEGNGILFERSILPRNEDIFSVEIQRDSADETAFAAALLGDVTSSDVGGGITRYTGAEGSCLIRSGGAVEASLSREVEDPAAFCDALFKTFGYSRTRTLLSDGSGSITGVRRSGEHSVFNASLTFSFSSGTLTSVSGTFLSSFSESRRADGLDAVSALVYFLDYRNTSGAVCTEILSVESGYLLQSSAAQFSLLPVWCITTDVNNYYVNCLTGDVTRQ